MATYMVDVRGVKIQKVADDGGVYKHHYIKGVKYWRMGYDAMHLMNRIAGLCTNLLVAIGNGGLDVARASAFVDALEDSAKKMLEGEKAKGKG
jgi:hypothetical protein